MRCRSGIWIDAGACGTARRRRLASVDRRARRLNHRGGPYARPLRVRHAHGVARVDCYHRRCLEASRERIYLDHKASTPGSTRELRRLMRLMRSLHDGRCGDPM
jgi:hypothetical protein